MEDYIHFPSESSSTCTDWCFPLHKIEFYMHRLVFSPSQSRVEHAQNAVFPSQNRLLRTQNGVFPYAESTPTSTEWCFPLPRIEFYTPQNGVFQITESTFFTPETTSRRGYECISGGYDRGTNTGLQQILPPTYQSRTGGQWVLRRTCPLRNNRNQKQNKTNKQIQNKT